MSLENSRSDLWEGPGDLRIWVWDPAVCGGVCCALSLVPVGSRDPAALGGRGSTSASGGWRDRALMLYSAISTGSSFTKAALEMWFQSAAPFLHPLLPLPAAPGLVVCRVWRWPKTAFGGMPTRSTEAPQGWGGSRPVGKRGTCGLAVPRAAPVMYRLGCALSAAARMFQDAFKSIPLPPPELTHMQLAKSNSNQLKNILKTENLCSMT